MLYTWQTPGEFAAVVLAAALVEGYKGPVFVQGDHMQIRRKNFATDPVKELDFIRALIKESIEAGFYNIDIDASTLVDIDQKSLLDQQLNNGKITAGITQFIRSIQPAGVTISIGGEIGENRFRQQHRRRLAGFYGPLSGIFAGRTQRYLQDQRANRHHPWRNRSAGRHNG